MSDSSTDIVVLGAGVIGLTAAIAIQATARYRTTLIAAATPTSTADNSPPSHHYTSPYAGAHWRSLALEELERELEALTLSKLLELARTSPDAGIYVCEGREYFEKHVEDPWYVARGVVGGYREYGSSELAEGCGFGFRYETVCINVPKHLAWLEGEFVRLGGRIVQRYVKDVRELGELDIGEVRVSPACVVNCTGLGSRTLGGVEDDKVYPTRGQTVLVEAPPDLKFTGTKRNSHRAFNSLTDFTYVIPRFDGTVVLGGTYQAHNSSTEPDRATTVSILTRCASMIPELRSLRDAYERGETSANGFLILKEKVGLRPTRVGGARIVAEKMGDVKVVHAYGHGGYGYQSGFATGERVVALVDSLVQ
ncbi:hypothetical protein BJ742DRAFT_703665 [Cladochytrium replicatum]|nr:hypothetical protein BJ742DRAFT_703665 [Cladochytrium replicatum]